MLTKRLKTASQIEFSDPEVTNNFKSLYLDTLGAEAVRRSAGYPNRSRQQTGSCDVEGYIHGTLSTAGIIGASPATHSLTKQAARTKARLGHHESQPAAAESASSQQVGATSADSESGMRPKQRHPAVTNRPNFTHTTLDIDGAQPHSKNIFTTPRNTDPLNPKYQLPASATLPLPSGPTPKDKLLSDPLKVADIPGATRKAPPPSSSRPGQLDVSDIEGSSAQWKSQHRPHAASKSRTAGLDVRDINTYMARFRPGPRSPLDKGHPGGPKPQPQVKPRHNPAVMDNSLRTVDIEGAKAVLNETRVGARQPHNHTTSVADIEGAAPADRDRVRLFERKSAAAAVMVADHEAAQAVLSGLSLEPSDLTALWRKCSSLDRDKSGYLTASELQSAMQSACMQLSQADTQRLLTALKNNAGLLNYKKLTQQLKGRISRPCSAKQSQAGQQQVPLDVARQAVEALQRAEPAAATSSATASGWVGSVATAAPSTTEGSSGESQAATNTHGHGVVEPAIRHQQQQCRPHTAPASKSKTAGSSGGSSSAGDSFKALSHWFGGSRRDVTAAQEGVTWRPGQDVKLLIAQSNTPDCSMSTPWVLACSGGGGSSNIHAAASSLPHEHGCSFCKQHQGSVPGDAQTGTPQGPDVVPGWVIGADPVQGTYKVEQPFDAEGQSEGAQTTGRAEAEAACSMPAATTSVCSAYTRPASATAARRGAARCCYLPDNTNSSRPAAAAAAASPWAAATAPLQRRPASAGPCCGRSSSRASDVSSTSGLAGSLIAPAAARAVDWMWSANGVDHGSSVLGACSGISRSISSQRLSGGGGDEELPRQQQHRSLRVHRKQRPQAASSGRMQRPASAQLAIQRNAIAAATSSTGCLNSTAPEAHHDSVQCCAVEANSRTVMAVLGSPLLTRPPSVGLAEQRRLVESMQQDLTAVRLLQ